MCFLEGTRVRYWGGVLSAAAESEHVSDQNTAHGVERQSVERPGGTTFPPWVGRSKNGARYGEVGAFSPPSIAFIETKRLFMGQGEVFGEGV